MVWHRLLKVRPLITCTATENSPELCSLSATKILCLIKIKKTSSFFQRSVLCGNFFLIKKYSDKKINVFNILKSLVTMGAICPKHLIIKEKRVVTSLKIKGNVTQTLGSFLKKVAKCLIYKDSFLLLFETKASILYM